MSMRVELFTCLTCFDWTFAHTLAKKKANRWVQGLDGCGCRRDMGYGWSDSSKMCALGKYTDHKENLACSKTPPRPMPTMPFKCSELVQASSSEQGPFDKWNFGQGGSGSSYQTLHERVLVPRMKYSQPYKGLDKKHSMTAEARYTIKGYQKRVISGPGLLTKQLLCIREDPTARQNRLWQGQKPHYNITLPEVCCVYKKTQALSATWLGQDTETKLF